MKETRLFYLGSILLKNAVFDLSIYFVDVARIAKYERTIALFYCGAVCVFYAIAVEAARQVSKAIVKIDNSRYQVLQGSGFASGVLDLNYFCNFHEDLLVVVLTLQSCKECESRPRC